MLNFLVVLLVSSHINLPNSEVVFLGCFSDTGLGLWGLYLRDVEFNQDGLRER